MLEKQGYSNWVKKLIISLGILAIVLLIYISYYFFFTYSTCDNESCYFKAASKCKRYSYIKEDTDSVWLYKIVQNVDKDRCKVDVTLIKMKEGNIDSENLQGKMMTCTIFRNQKEFPEKDISTCTGLLKEDIQDILIQRMHKYILENINGISKEFNQTTL